MRAATISALLAACAIGACVPTLPPLRSRALHELRCESVRFLREPGDRASVVAVGCGRVATYVLEGVPSSIAPRHWRREGDVEPADGHPSLRRDGLIAEDEPGGP